MKILYVTPYYKPAWFYGGPPKCIAEQAEYLASRYGYEIHVVTLNKNGSSPLFNSQEPVVEHVNGVIVHYLPVAKNLLGKKYFQAKGLADYLEKFNEVDLIHVHMLFNAFSVAGFQLGVKYQIPYIVSLHGMLDNYSLTRSKWMKRFHRFFLEDNYLQQARAVHFTTENEFKNAVINKPIHPVVIPLGFFFEGQNDHTPHFPPQPEIYKLIFIGRINRKKGIDLLIEGIHLLPTEIRNNVRLDIYGEEDEPCKPELEVLIQNYGLQERIHFKGNLPPEER
ncbi:MAG: glycosyltransferase, partial [Cytophagales bacterium]|nr:glycosyltransferase [Cytophagales bacterium]